MCIVHVNVILYTYHVGTHQGHGHRSEDPRWKITIAMADKKLSVKIRSTGWAASVAKQDDEARLQQSEKASAVWSLRPTVSRELGNEGVGRSCKGKPTRRKRTAKGLL